MYKFDFKNKNVLGNIRSPKIWQFNLAMNMALLSNDAKVIRYFWRVDSRQFVSDTWMAAELSDKFLGKYLPGQAFTYFGLCPMIVNGVQNLIASAGFLCDSDDKGIDLKLNGCIEKNKLQELFSDGVYYESGLGDFAYRISYNPEISNRPLIDIIEPQHLQLVYKRNRLKTIVVKEVTDEEKDLELHEVYSKNAEGYVVVEYFFYKDDRYIFQKDDKEAWKQYLKIFGMKAIDMKAITLPLKEFPVIYKKNHVNNLIYKGQRGVPDIMGLDTIEDALSESISDLTDAIRKAGVKEFVDDSLLEQDEDGNIRGYDPFNKTIIKTKGSSLENKNLVTVVQGEINWEAYVETAKYLISSALNKAGISPTTIGITGLESINSSQESQDAREKPSLRKRKESLKTWNKTLKDLLNRYLQMCDYIDGEEIGDYSNFIHIKFNEYVNPTQESIVDLLEKKLGLGITTHIEAMKELDPTLTAEQAGNKLLAIVQEQQLLAGAIPVIGDEESTDEPTEALNEEKKEPSKALKGVKETSNDTQRKETKTV